MMEKMNKWLSAHKQLCVITGIFGLLVSPFLWPIFLAVIIQSLSLVIPVAAGLFFYEKFIMKKDKEQFFSNHANHKRRYSDLFVVIPDQRDRTGNGSPHRGNVWGRHTECF